MRFKMRPIERIRDDKGKILTYKTKTESGIEIERNTLKEARIFASIIDEEK